MRCTVGVRTPRTAISFGRRLRGPKPTVWFDSCQQLAGVLSDENRHLLRLIRAHRPRTMAELAELAGRAPSNLSRTLKMLERHGLVKLHRSIADRAVRPEAVATEFLVVLD